MSPGDKVVRIGGASGFWGDSSLALPQLLAEGGLDYIVFDYLAEVTMSILAGARAKNPQLGYATDFVHSVREHAAAIAVSGVRLVANAGGVNPRACAEALRAAAAEAGVTLRVAVVEGDDAMPLVEELRARGTLDMARGEPLPARLLTANAYLGALPIRDALAAGAQVVVTGRCVDSATTLGALLHAFGWAQDDYDRLAQGSIAGHVIECGCQATGGLYTDWRDVPGWEHIGFPIVECERSGRFVVTKPRGTGGLVTPATVAEQILYEVGDPRRYVLPDVICDFSEIRLGQDGVDRVVVDGVKGLPPTGTYKVSATHTSGFKAAAQLTVIGFDAAAKAERIGAAILARTRAIFEAKSLGDYGATHIELLGAESAYGPHSRAREAREVVLRLAVRHADRRALEIFAREVAPAGTAFAPGITGAGGRAQPAPAIEQVTFLLPKTALVPRVVFEGEEWAVTMPEGLTSMPAASTTIAPSRSDPAPESRHDGDLVVVPLVDIAHGRSGDKGDTSNIGLVARSAELLPWLRREVTAERVRGHLGHLVLGSVTRYDVPGLRAVNFVCEQALGGGGMASLRNDALGKGMAQILLSMPVTVPRRLLGVQQEAP